MPEATGRPGYHPSVFLKLYVYGYLTRVQSSRRLEREAGCSVEVTWLTGRLVPDHKTVADYRKDNGSAIRKVGSRGADGLGGLGRPHLEEERAHDGAGDLVLDLKEVHQIVIVALGPNMPGGGGVDDGARILLVISGQAAILATRRNWCRLAIGARYSACGA